MEIHFPCLQRVSADMRSMGLMSLVHASLLAALSAAAGEDPPAPADLAAKEAATAAAWAAEALADMRCAIAGGDGTALVRTPESVLRWTCPDAGRVYGEVFLWTRDGRPVAVLSLFRWFSPWRSRQAEFLSLAEDPLVVEADGRVLWQPEAAGLAWRELDDAPAPAATPSRRLAQMRMMARRFRAELVDRRGGEEAVSRELRLLSRPIYHYGEGTEADVEGALFALVAGTDPELFLWIEARPRGGRTAWRYAAGRMNADSMALDLDGRRVWEAPALDTERYEVTSPYCLIELHANGEGVADGADLAPPGADEAATLGPEAAP